MQALSQALALKPPIITKVKTKKRFIIVKYIFVTNKIESQL